MKPKLWNGTPKRHYKASRSRLQNWSRCTKKGEASQQTKNRPCFGGNDYRSLDQTQPGGDLQRCTLCPPLFSNFLSKVRVAQRSSRHCASLQMRPSLLLSCCILLLSCTYLVYAPLPYAIFYGLGSNQSGVTLLRGDVLDRHPWELGFPEYPGWTVDTNSGALAVKKLRYFTVLTDPNKASKLVAFDIADKKTVNYVDLYDIRMTGLVYDDPSRTVYAFVPGTKQYDRLCAINITTLAWQVVETFYPYEYVPGTVAMDLGYSRLFFRMTGAGADLVRTFFLSSCGLLCSLFFFSSVSA